MENMIEDEELNLPSDKEENYIEQDDDTPDKENPIKRFFKSHKKLVIIVFGIILIIVGIFSFAKIKSSKMKNAMQEIKITVERRDIKNTVSGSSVIEPKDSYNVTAMVTGEIISDTFSEGDVVKKDDVLYQIDSETVQQSVQTSENSLTKAKNSLEKAQRTYNEAVKSQKNGALDDAASIESAQNSLEKAQRSYNSSLQDYNDLSVSSDITGKVSEVYVKEGDSVQNGTKIAAVYSDEYMELRLPFNESDISQVSVGATAQITIAGMGDEITGTVTEVSTATSTTSTNAIVNYVTIQAKNPGALTADDKGTAIVNGVASNDVGSFRYTEDTAITARTAGKVINLGISANDSVYAGQVVATLESDSLDDTVQNALIAVEEAQMSLEKTKRSADGSSNETSVINAKIALDEAKLALEDSQISLSKSKKNLEDYTIKAPIDGTVVTKNKKKGDKLENGSNSGDSAMAVIFDLSSLKLQMSVDETEVQLVKVGQEVSITADAIEGKTFKGTVTKVGIDGTSSNGVTTYPIDVEIKEYGELLPGMNVTAEIVVQEVKGVLAVPVTSVQRGNVVYVKGEKENEEDKAPEGYKSVRVELGINDEDYIEIKSGLKEGEELKGVTAQGNDFMQMMHGMGGMGGPPMGGGMSGGNRSGAAGGANRGGMGGGMR